MAQISTGNQNQHPHLSFGDQWGPRDGGGRGMANGIVDMAFAPILAFYCIAFIIFVFISINI